MNYWLFKTEPTTFGLEHLRKSPKQTTAWDGVRNFQARNHLRAMKKGDQGFLYHSSCEAPGIVAIIQIIREAYPDPTAFDPTNDHYDEKSDPQAPRWFMVDIKLQRPLQRALPLQELRQHADKLAGFTLLKAGNRLSVFPMTKKHWHAIIKLEQKASAS